jgi:hypothetical protein
MGGLLWYYETTPDWPAALTVVYSVAMALLWVFVFWRGVDEFLCWLSGLHAITPDAHAGPTDARTLRAENRVGCSCKQPSSGIPKRAFMGEPRQAGAPEEAKMAAREAVDRAGWAVGIVLEDGGLTRCIELRVPGRYAVLLEITFELQTHDEASKAADRGVARQLVGTAVATGAQTVLWGTEGKARPRTSTTCVDDFDIRVTEVPTRLHHHLAVKEDPIPTAMMTHHKMRIAGPLLDVN